MYHPLRRNTNGSPDARIASSVALCPAASASVDDAACKMLVYTSKRTPAFFAASITARCRARRPLGSLAEISNTLSTPATADASVSGRS